MSDGGSENARDIEHKYRKKISRIDDFSQSIAKISVAQVCESVGFQSFQQSALCTLSDVAVRYIREIGQTVTFYANSAGRTECNVFDIIQGLEDFGSLQGFSGASDVNHCLAGSGIVRDISRYVDEAEEVPFAYPIPCFPIVKERKLTPSFEQVGESPPDDHIPSWLPQFPDPDTYAPLSSENEREAEIATENNELANDHMMVGRPFRNWQQNLACNGSEELIAAGESNRAERAAESNPFLAAPLLFPEKEVSSVILPAKFSNEAVAKQNCSMLDNYVSVLETPVPVIEAKKSRLCNFEEGGNKVSLNKRHPVQLKFATSKKPSSSILKLRNQYIKKTSLLFENQSEEGDKKKMAEKILENSAGKPQELAPL